MPVEVGQAYVSIIPSMKGAVNTIKSSLGDSSLGKDVGEKLGSGITSGVSASTVAIGNVIGGLANKAVSAFMDTMSAGISRSDTLNSFNRMMVSLGETSEAADAAVSKIKSSLDGLPTSTADIASFVQQIKATGVGLDDATDYALALNNALLAGTTDSTAISNAMSAYTKILTKGTAEMDQWMSLVNAAPASMAALAESLLGSGKTQNDLREALNNGTVSIKQFNEALVKLNKEGSGELASFEEQARANTDGIQTALNLISSRMGQQWYKIIEQIGASNIASVINNFSKSFNTFGDIAVAAIESVQNAIAPWADTIYQAWYGALDALYDFKDGTVKLCGPIIQAIESMAKSLGASLGANIASVATDLGEFVSTLAEALPYAIEAVTPYLRVIINTIGAELSGALEIATMLIEPVAWAFWGVMEVLTAFKTAVLDVADAFSSGFLTAFEDIDVGNLSDVFVDAIMAITDVISGLAEPISTVAWLLGKVLGGALKTVIELVTPVVSWIGEQLTGALETLSAFISDEVTPSVYEFSDAFEGDAANTLQMVIDLIVANLLPAIEQLSTWIQTNVIPVIQSLAEWVVTVLVPAFMDLCDWMSVHVLPLLQQLGEWLSTSVGPAIGELAGWVGDELLPALGDLAVTIGETLGPILQDLAEWFTDELCPAIGDFATMMGETLGPVFETIGGWIVDTAIPAIGDFIDKIGELADWVGTKFQEIQDWFSSLDFEWPHISLPQFIISPPGWQIGDLLKGSIPSLSIEWKAKGGLFEDATLIGVGEKGTELAWPAYEPYLSKYAAAIAGYMPSGAGASVTNVYVGESLVASSPTLNDRLWDFLAEVERMGGGNVG